MKRERFSGAAVLPSAEGTWMSRIMLNRVDSTSTPVSNGRMQIKLLAFGILINVLIASAILGWVPSETFRSIAENSKNFVAANQAKDRFTTVYKNSTNPSWERLVQTVCAKGACLDV